MAFFFLQTNINECVGDPCLAGGQCTDLVNDFVCACVPGRTGRVCEVCHRFYVLDHHVEIITIMRPLFKWNNSSSK